MSGMIVSESGEVVLELHGALSDIDRARWSDNAPSMLRPRIHAVVVRLGQLLEQKWPAKADHLRLRLGELRTSLQERLPSEEGTLASAQTHWLAFRSAMIPTYEALSETLRRESIHVPTLRPTNYKRNILHVCSASLGLFALYLLPEPRAALFISVPVFIAAWSMEGSRRLSPKVNRVLMALFAPVAHPHEAKRINSATWYATALLILSVLDAPVCAGIALAVLGVGDPAAAIIGRRFGRVTLIHGRSLEGTLAFVAVATIAGLFAASLFAEGLAFPSLLLLSFAGAASGALAELTSLRVDDNLSITLAATAGVWLTAMLASIPL